MKLDECFGLATVDTAIWKGNRGAAAGFSLRMPVRRANGDDEVGLYPKDAATAAEPDAHHSFPRFIPLTASARIELGRWSRSPGPNHALALAHGVEAVRGQLSESFLRAGGPENLSLVDAVVSAQPKVQPEIVL